jgi:hypothetical protein
MKQMMEKQAQAIDALNRSAQAFQPLLQYHQGDKVWLEASNQQIKPETIWTIPHLKGDLISGVST